MALPVLAAGAGGAGGGGAMAGAGAGQAAGAGANMFGKLLDFGADTYWKHQANSLARRENRQAENQRRFNRLLQLLGMQDQQNQMYAQDNRVDSIRNWSM